MKRRTLCLSLLLAPWAPLSGCTGSEGDAPTAAEVSYEASQSGLAGKSVQQALDELASSKANGTVLDRVDDLESTVGELGATVADHEAALFTIPDRIEALEGAPSPSAADVPYDTGAEPSTVQVTLQGLSEALATQAKAIKSLEGQVVSQKADLALAQSEIAALKQETATIAASVESTAEALTQDLDAKLAAPRPCPLEMLAVSGVTCMEPGLRQESGLIAAIRGCSDAGSRLCTAEELVDGCSKPAPAGLVNFIADVPEWSSSVMERLVYAEPKDELFEAAFAAIGGLSCDMAVAAGSSKMAPGTTTLKFPYRCCLSR